jgi:hypothetical protein
MPHDQAREIILADSAALIAGHPQALTALNDQIAQRVRPS